MEPCSLKACKPAAIKVQTPHQPTVVHGPVLNPVQESKTPIGVHTKGAAAAATGHRHPASRSHFPQPPHPTTLSPAINGSQPTDPGRVHSTTYPLSLTGGAHKPLGPVPSGVLQALACGSHPERIIRGRPGNDKPSLWATPRNRASLRPTCGPTGRGPHARAKMA